MLVLENLAKEALQIFHSQQQKVNSILIGTSTIVLILCMHILRKWWIKKQENNSTQSTSQQKQQQQEKKEEENNEEKNQQQQQKYKNIDLSDKKAAEKLVLEAFGKYSKEFQSSKIMETIIPSTINNSQDLDVISTKLSYSQTPEVCSINNAISLPIWDILDRGGKRIRPVFCGLFAEAFGRKFTDVIEIAGFIEILHNASLIIDDIEDESKMRRGKPAIHKLYGVDISINAGNFAYFAPLQYLYKNQEKFGTQQLLKLSQIYAEEMTSIHLGQAWDIQWHNHKFKNFFPTEEQYLQMVVFKTGVLFRMMSKMTAVVLELDQDVSDAMSNFCEKIGAAFQIQDDILSVDVDIGDFAQGKGLIGEDIYEGKITLLVLHLLRTANEEDKKRFTELLTMRTDNPQLIQEAIELMRKYGSIDYAKNYAKKTMKEAYDQLDAVLEDSKAKQQIQAICQYVIDRTK